MNAAPVFADEQFMSAQEKATVFRAWIRFLKNRFAYQQFTNALYEHLTLHCSCTTIVPASTSSISAKCPLQPSGSSISLIPENRGSARS